MQENDKTCVWLKKGCIKEGHQIDLGHFELLLCDTPRRNPFVTDNANILQTRKTVNCLDFFVCSTNSFFLLVTKKSKEHFIWGALKVSCVLTSDLLAEK